MNSNFGKTGFNTLDFDLGLGSRSGSRSLNDQKNKSNPTYSYTSSTTSTFSQPKTTPSWQAGKPSWTHQPAPTSAATRTELGGPTSLVGDIKGKSWGSLAPGSSGPGSSVGIVNKNPNLFGDLVSSALGQNKSSSNAPLKSAPPAKSSSFSMGGMADSLPKTNSSSPNFSNNNNNSTNSVKNGNACWGPFASATTSSTSGYGNSGVNKGSGLGGPPLKGGGGIGGGVGASKDPLVTLVDFGSKPMGGTGTGLNSTVNGKASSMPSDDFAFGDFQNASKSSSSAFNHMGSSTASIPKMDDFAAKSQTLVQPAVVDSFDDTFFSSSSASGGNTAAATATGGEQFSGGDDWGFDSGLGGGHDDGATTELEGLPPPPAGVSASTAKAKGLDNYKQGQYADAIKWLSWAEVLLEKAGETASTKEVLTCRASCYKEVGEYKKAVADCTKVLDHDGANVAVLVQRALLYESMEKYRLGADDLRTVMKLDPGNRVARSTIHRLNQMAG